MNAEAWQRALIEGLDLCAGHEVRKRLLCGLGEPPASLGAADWICKAVARMDCDLAPEVCAAVLARCGRTCLGEDQVERARDAGRRFADLETLLSFLNENQIGGGDLRTDGDTVYATYDRCYCPHVSASAERMSPSHCNCSRGWLGALFEALLGCGVDVELRSSILSGASSCAFVIRPVRDWR